MWVFPRFSHMLIIKSNVLQYTLSAYEVVVGSCCGFSYIFTHALSERPAFYNTLSLSAYKVVAGSSLLVFLCFHTCLITASRVLHYTLSADEVLVCVAGTSVDSACIMRKERRKEPRRLRKHARHEQRRI